MARILRLLLACCLMVSTAAVGLVVTAVPALAGPGQAAGAPQVTLNPGGGIRADGTDGMRFTINAGPGNYWNTGNDAVFYRNTEQYCCSAGAPTLNVGGTMFGQAGAAADLNGANWTSLAVVSTSGSTALGARTTTTGNASATVRYVATKNSRDYLIDRTVTYTYPNDFVTDTYTFTIPAGNTDQVKFYLGGDTAPGGSDRGYGIALTSPVRSVISLNTSSQIQFGFREVPGSKVFDGATSQAYNIPYSTVNTGGNIGFAVTAATHDAGLMVQWNLGSTPGTQTASLQQFVNKQGTNLTAGFDRVFTTAGAPVNLDISVENTILTAQSGLGFTIALPAGTAVAAGAVTNSCGGTFTATTGGSSVVLSGGTVGAGTNCVARVPVVATTYGTYTMSAANVSGTSGVTNNVGTSAFFVPLAPSWEQTDLATLTVGTVSSAAVTAAGAPTPTYAVTGGTLPAGLTLNSETGALTGTPTTGGAYSFTVTATNNGGTAARTFTGTVERGLPALTVTSSAASVDYGSTVSLTAAGLPAGATGTVTVSSGATTLCSVTLPSTSCTTGVLDVGSYPVTAVYSGDTNWAPRTVEAAGFTVSAVASTVTSTFTDTTTTFGTGVTVTAGVTPAGATGRITVFAGEVEACGFDLPATSCTTTAALAPGTYPVLISYAGDARHLASSLAAGSLVVDRATSSPTPDDTYLGVYGEPLVLTLPGLPAGATGTVTFTVGDTVICSYDLADDPQSCTADGVLDADEYEMTAAYSGDVNYTPASDTVALIIDRVSTSVATDETASGTYGTPVTVTVGGLPEAATGTVTVLLGDETLCTTTLPDTACTLPADLPAGEHQLTVVYGGDDNHLGSNTVIAVTVDPRPTTITAAASVTAVFGTPARIDAAGLPAGATGTVTVTGGPLGTECTWTIGEATGCDTTGSTPAGTWPLTVTYGGDADHLPSSVAVSLVVERSAAELSAPAAVAGVFGLPTPVGPITLPLGATGTVTVTVTTEGVEGLVASCTFDVPGESGCALPADIPAGSHLLTVDYAGDGNYLPASTTAPYTVAQAPTAVTLPDADLTYGDPGVIGVSGLPTTATGTVEIRATVGDADVLLCSVTLPAVQCAPTVVLPAGEYPLRASYLGDANHEPSESESATVTVAKGSAGGEVTGPDTAVYGTPSVFSLTGTAPGATGTVTVRSGDTVLCSFTLPGETSCAAPADLPAGSYDVVVSYSGDANYDSAEKQGTLVIGPATPGGDEPDTVTVTFGTAPVFSLDLPDDATGTVVVRSGDVELCRYTLPDATSCTGPADIPGGEYAVVYSYEGDGNYEAVDVDGSLVVTPGPVTVTAPGAIGTTAGTDTVFTVTGLPADATGTVQVLANGVLLCTITLPSTTCTLGASLAPGSYDLQVLYSGDGNYAPYDTTSTLVVGSVPTPGTPAPTYPAPTYPTPSYPTATPGLAYTGTDVGSMLWAALLFVVIGGTTLYAGRRRTAAGDTQD